MQLTDFDKDQDTVRSFSRIMNLCHITNFPSEGTLKGRDYNQSDSLFMADTDIFKKVKNRRLDLCP